MTEIASLIERLEKATDPDREIDRDIWFAQVPALRDCWPYWTAEQQQDMCPRYTKSIEAALTLAPEDGGRIVSNSGRVVEMRMDSTPGRRHFASLNHDHVGFSRATLAIAICIAALKAKEDDLMDHDELVKRQRLLDMFAAHALTGLIAGVVGTSGGYLNERQASAAYDLAEAMLDEREKRLNPLVEVPAAPAKNPEAKSDDEEIPF
jgi:hypothetical protein